MATTLPTYVPPIEGTFQTGVGIISNPKQIALPPIDPLNQTNYQLKCPTFFDASPPQHDPSRLSLPIPVDLEKIKKNANNSLTKVKISLFLQNPDLDELVDALISDSFWFIVCFFQSDNQNLNPNKPPTENNIPNTYNSYNHTVNKSSNISPENKSNISASKSEGIAQITKILKRISCNYFKFFIRVCDMGPSRKNDPVLNVFRDFMSQSVYYAIYLAFPKSRYWFGEDFRNRIVLLFAYLYHGLVSENNFATLHWELDLGKGNIIENFAKYKDEPQWKLPDITELQMMLDKYIYKKKEFDSFHKALVKKHTLEAQKGKNKKYLKKEVNADILNTPWYRLYAEMNKFETWNLLKPIKITNRKIIDIQQISKNHANYVKFAKDTIKNAAERKIQYEKLIAEKDAEFQNKINEVKQNDNRMRKEFLDIKVQRVQEYANYCIFISSK